MYQADKRTRRELKRIFSILLTLVFGSVPLLAQDPNDTSDASPPPVELIARLESHEFAERQNATFQILRTPEKYIPLIESQIEEQDAEFRFRAFKILKELALQSRHRDSQAFQVLQRIGNTENPILARKATQATFDVLVARQFRAARKLERLNARVSYGEAIESSTFAMANRLVIDKNWRGSREELASLVSELFGVTDIVFDHEQVDDSVISELSEVYALDRIKLRKCSVSNDSLKSLAALGTLTQLEVLYCSVGPEAIDTFENFGSLRSLRLIGTNYNVSHESQLSLNVHGKIDIRKGAYLGILYNPSVRECVLTSIAEGSGAKASGLKVGDQIIEYGGHEIPGHEELTELLRVTEVKHKTMVKVKRDGKTLELEVTLGEWQ